MTLPSFRKKYSIAVHAHRGYSAKYPENTLLAFKKAIEAGADYIELDVHESSDSHVVVIHDSSTGRVADSNLEISQSTLEEIKNLNLPENQKIPTLREVFELCQGKIGINIEIKQAGITSHINDLIQEFKMESDVIISSFLHEELVKFKRINPNLIYTTLEPTGGNIWAYMKALFHTRKFLNNTVAVGAQGTNPFYKYVTKSFCQNAHELNITVNPWTIDSPKIWAKLIKSGVDSIITNDAPGLLEYLKKYHPE
ncbi:MAG: hypothetical protein DRO88_01580 [Promethearchaeia archaeon]|nr:MAG: hypothetical protein DRO88_01580 [Candidatus Lokiarchaeia archaeon]